MPDIKINEKKINQLEVKLFVTSMLLQELLDETDGNTKFKHKLKFHIRGMQHELDKVLSVILNDNELSLFITNAISALEGSIDNKLE
tara:strand:+ start:862 stop:1122 length:261 start_codon:yes stop_codon:yes gene_type:complete